MKSTIFTIEIQQMLTIGDCLQSDLFECTSVSAKNRLLKPSADSTISDFQSVQFAVKGKSSLGFRLTFDGKEYQLSILNLATASDWTGALIFLRFLLTTFGTDFCYNEGNVYDKESILNFNYKTVFLTALSEITQEVKVHPIIQLEGVRRPIYINEFYLGQIVHVSDEQLIDSYDKRLRLTQYIHAYFSEQQVYKVEQSSNTIIVPVNYINSEVLTILPAKPELFPRYQKQYQGSLQAKARLFILNAKGEKLAEVPYEEFLQSLTEGIFMLDAKYVAIQPMSPERLQELLSK